MIFPSILTHNLLFFSILIKFLFFSSEFNIPIILLHETYVKDDTLILKVKPDQY